MTLKTICIVLSFACISMLFAGYGETGANFIKMSTSPASAGKGGTGATSCDGPEALTINPAGISLKYEKQIFFSHQIWFEQMSHNYVGIIYPTSFGNIALGMTYARSGEIQGHDNFLYTGEYSATEIAGTLGYARAVTDRLNVGLSGVIISQKIENESANGLALNAGVIYQIREYKTDIGFVLRNIGNEIKFLDEGDPLPTTIELEISKGFMICSYGIKGYAGVEKVIKEEFNYKAGTEVAINNFFSIRAGYQSKQSFSTGIEIKWGQFTVDYAYVPYKNLSSTNHFGVRYRF